VTVAYSGFEPACVRVTASNPDGTSRRTTDVPVPDGSREGQLLVAVFREPAWGRAQTLQVSAEAHELDCEGPVVAYDSRDVGAPEGQTREATLALAATDADQDRYVASPAGRDCADGDPSRHPGAAEVCDGLDQDCNGQTDETFALDAGCDGGGCEGRTRCSGDGSGVICVAVGTLDWYPDLDMDGWGDTAAPSLSCSRPTGAHVRDAGDCDDMDDRTYPGAPELCDGKANGCQGAVDQGFNVDAGCTSQFGCSGVIACQADGGAACLVTGGGTLHPDQDEDGAGAAGTPVCGTPDGSFVANQDDCDDGDPFTALGFPEICDRRDNDCDGVADRVVTDGGNPCPPSPAWVDKNIGGGGHQGRGIWSWTDGGVWAVTLGDRMEFKRPGDSAFTARDCAGDWQAVWADPADGHAYAVGLGAKMVRNTGSACFDRSSISGTPTEPSGIVGFGSAPSLDLYVVGLAGDTARWDGGAGVQALGSTNARLVDVHGTSPDVMFAVGLRTSTPREPRIYRFVPPASWAAETLPAPVEASSASVEGVHVVSPRLAYAVTDAGHVLRWNGQAWDTHPSPDAGPLRAVLAFGTSSVFALSPTALWEWDGGSWGRILSGTGDPMYDLHGTNPADIWVVGDEGDVHHWPQ
jgi:hypothetical protein